MLSILGYLVNDLMAGTRSSLQVGASKVACKLIKYYVITGEKSTRKDWTFPTTFGLINWSDHQYPEPLDSSPLASLVLRGELCDSRIL